MNRAMYQKHNIVGAMSNLYMLMILVLYAIVNDENVSCIQIHYTEVKSIDRIRVTRVVIVCVVSDCSLAPLGQYGGS